MNTTAPIPEPAARAARARFALGQAVRHLSGDLHGLVVDADPRFPGEPGATGSISPDQTFYKVLVQNADGAFVACVAEAWLEADPAADTLDAEELSRWFTLDAQGHHAPRSQSLH